MGKTIKFTSDNFNTPRQAIVSALSRADEFEFVAIVAKNKKTGNIESCYTSIKNIAEVLGIISYLRRSIENLITRVE